MLRRVLRLKRRIRVVPGQQRWPLFPDPERSAGDNPFLDALHADKPLRVWSLIVTIFGDVVMRQGRDRAPGPIWIGPLLLLLERLGVDSGLARTSLSRLVANGVLERDKAGRNTFYRLTPASAAGIRARGRQDLRAVARPRPRRASGSRSPIAPPIGRGARAALEADGFPLLRRQFRAGAGARARRRRRRRASSWRNAEAGGRADRARARPLEGRGAADRLTRIFWRASTPSPRPSSCPKARSSPASSRCTACAASCCAILACPKPRCRRTGPATRPARRSRGCCERSTRRPRHGWRSIGFAAANPRADRSKSPTGNRGETGLGEAGCRTGAFVAGLARGRPRRNGALYLVTKILDFIEKL